MRGLRFIRVDEKNASMWDRFVTNNESGHFMQSFCWGCFKQQTGWEPVYLMAIEDDEVKGASLLLSKSLPLVKKLIYYLPRGPVVDFHNNVTFLFLMNNIKKYVKDNDGIFLRTDPYLKDTIENNSLYEQIGFKKSDRKWSLWNCPRFVFWLNMGSGIEELFKKLSTKIRNQIRYPHKRGVEFIKGDLSDIKEFYSLMVGTAFQKGIGLHDINYYKELYKTLSDASIAQLFLAKHEGKAIATGISLAYGKRAWLLYLASSSEHFRLRPNRALQWEMIKWAAEQGCEVYDFRGTAADDPPDPKDPGFGVYEFKKSFGPEYVRLVGYYDFVVNRPIYLLFIFAEYYLFPLVAKGLVELSKLKKAIRVF